MCDLLREYPDAFSGVGELVPELNIKIEEGGDPELFSRRIPEALRLSSETTMTSYSSFRNNQLLSEWKM